MKRNITILPILLLLCNCLVVTQNNGTQLNPVEQLPAETMGSIASQLQIPTPTPLWGFPQWYEQVDIKCETYLETTWGDGFGQWGDPTKLHRDHDFFTPPSFSSKGEVYISDFANRRLLKYDGRSPYPIQSIELPKYYFSVPGTLTLPWATPILTQDLILVAYGMNKIGLLYLDGKEKGDITVPYDYYLLLSPWQVISVDSRGGLFVNGEKLSYFDVGWQEEKWNQISTIPSPHLGLFVWNDLVGFEGADKGLALLLYKINPSSDFLNNPWQTKKTGLPFGPLIAGTDKDGWIYIYGNESFNSMPVFARYSLLDGQGQIAAIPNEIAPSIIRSGVAPDGTIYLILYNKNDVAVDPKIVKCRFPDG